MTKKVYDLAVKTGTYTNRSGEEKGRWKNIGSVLQLDDGGKVILLDRTFNPAGVPNPDGRDSVMVSMFPPKEHDEAPAKAPAPKSQGGFDDDAVPF
jgi:hypothetical protein